MLLGIYELLLVAALVATFITVLTVDTRGFWSDIWLFTGPLGLLLSLLLAAASVNIEAVSNGTTLQVANEYLVTFWMGLAGFNVLYLVFGPIAKLREALDAGPSQSPIDAGRDANPVETGRETRGRVLDAFGSTRRNERQSAPRRSPSRPTREESDRR